MQALLGALSDASQRIGNPQADRTSRSQKVSRQFDDLVTTQIVVGN